MKISIHKWQVTRLFFILLLCLLPSALLRAQQKNIPLNREWELDFEKKRGVIDKPSIIADVYTNDSKQTGWLNSILPQPDRTCCFKPYISTAVPITDPTSHSRFFRKLKKESLFIVKDSSEKFHLSIDPLFNFEFGRDLASKNSPVENLHKNTRGVLVRGSIGSKFSFESSFYENQSTFVDYIDKFNDTYFVIPGQGRWKKFKNNGYDFAMASGYISYSPNKHFNFQVGHGKHFVGEGYRSLLLSDNAFNYPFARITSSFGKFQYTTLYAALMNLTEGGVTTPPGTEKLFQKKAANFQFLSWNIHRRIQWGVFQGLIWHASDSTNRECLKLSYASPIIYTAALSEGLNGKNNVLVGTTLKFKITNSISLYGQYMMDDFSEIKNSLHNKTGWQAGVKYFDLFGAKNLHLQAEYNQVRPYSYAHSLESQSYTHYNQPLAHPLGANFKEAIVFLNYQLGDFFTELKVNYAIIGKDSTGRNYGNTVFYSTDQAFYTTHSSFVAMGQGLNTILRIIDFHIGYLVNPSTHFNIVAGISNRSSINTTENVQTNFVYFGIRTSLNNLYYDF